MKKPIQKWQGKAAIFPGTGVFIGRSGDNEAHKHWAHQLSIALENEVVVFSGEKPIVSKAVFIPANIAHSLRPGLSLSLYLDPGTAQAEKMLDYVNDHTCVCEVREELTDLVLSCFKDNSDLQAGIKALNHTFYVHDVTATNSRRDAVLNRLQNVLRGEEIKRDELAQLTCLSSSRFSHWFKEETGMPLRSYIKWLHLIRGVEAILKGNSLQAAAHTSNFSDQAHFSRTFKQAFGMSPGSALAEINRRFL